MSSPILVAAAPTLITVLEQLQVAISTILTGDPMQAPGRALAASEIFLGQLQLLLPGLVGAELAAGNASINAKIGSLITQLKSLTP